METTDIWKFQSRIAGAVRVLAFFRAKPGNIVYVLYRWTKNPDELVFDEIFIPIGRLKSMHKSSISDHLCQG